MLSNTLKIILISVVLAGLTLSTVVYADSYSDRGGSSSGSSDSYKYDEDHYRKYDSDSRYTYPSNKQKKYKRRDSRRNYRTNRSYSRGQHHHEERKRNRYNAGSRQNRYSQSCRSVGEIISSIRKRTRGRGRVVGIKKVRGGYRATVQYANGRVRVTFVRC